MADDLTLRVHRGRSWTVTLDRPARANALSPTLVDALHGVLDEVADVRPEALVLEGGGRHFAAGLDLSGLERESDASLAWRLLRIGTLLERLLTLPTLTVAVVRGAAVGAGADLALACDHRVGTPGASFRFPGSAFGAVLGTARLADQAGAATALDAGRRRAAPEALRSGLLTHLVDEPALGATVGDLVDGWSATAPHARPALLAAARRFDADAALAALTRSVTTPGLHRRVETFARAPRPVTTPTTLTQEIA